MAIFAENLGVKVIRVDAEERFLRELAGVADPEAKRKIIGRLFVEVFDEESNKLAGEGAAEHERVGFLAQGTIYSDVIESAGAKTGKAHLIKSHHNVGGLPAHMKLKNVTTTWRRKRPSSPSSLQIVSLIPRYARPAARSMRPTSRIQAKSSTSSRACSRRAVHCATAIVSMTPRWPPASRIPRDSSPAPTRPMRARSVAWWASTCSVARRPSRYTLGLNRLPYRMPDDAFSALVLGVLLAMSATGCASTGGPRQVGGHSISERYTATSHDSRVQFIVLHNTETGFGESLKILTEGPVSSHYLVDANPPRIYRLVPEGRRAWHAGASSWRGVTALNATSIGIEIVNDGNNGHREGPFAPYDPAQVEAVVALVKDIATRYRVQPHHIVGHSDIAPQRKQDPGPAFPWQRLVQAGLVPWPDEALVAEAQARFTGAVPAVAWFQEKLAAHGFEVPRHGELDVATRNVIAAFQMKYRPARCDGEPGAETAAWLEVATTPGG